MTLTTSESDQAVSGVQHPVLVAVAVIVISSILWRFALGLWGPLPYKGFPIVGKEPGEWTSKKAQARFMGQSRQLLKKGLEQFSGPFQMFTPGGVLIVLPPKYADEIRNDERLSFSAWMEKNFFVGYSEFAPFHSVTQGDILQETIRTKLNLALGQITQDLSKETTSILNELLPPSTEWKETAFYGIATEIAARLSAKVFLGEPLCRNRELIDISIKFTHVALQAKTALERIPGPLRPAAARFWLPEMRQVREIQATMARLIEPEIQARRARRAAAEKAGEDVAKPADSLEWMDAVARGRPWDFAAAQLLLNFNAIHTTSLTLTHLLHDLVAHPECVAELRAEVAGVLRADGGWRKTSLYKMKLLDSCMKESQRVNVQSPLFMNRITTAPLTLSDGTHLPRNAAIAVPTLHMHSDPALWGPTPSRFDGHRFLRLRAEPGNENRGQFVTTSADHLGFGHGRHACPGRFFAASEMKVAAAHLLLKYEWKFEEGGRPANVDDGTGQNLPDAKTVVAFRGRVPEIDVDAL